VNEVIGIVSTLIERTKVESKVSSFES
jgi:hypothetical protein